MINKEQLSFVLSKLQEYSKSLSEEDSPNAHKSKFCISILENIEEEYDEWVNSCPFSMENVSEYISVRYIKIDGISDPLYLSTARFLRERLLYLERNGHKDSWISGDWYNFKRDSKNLINPKHQHWLDYIINGQFDIDIINHYLGDKNYQAFLKYEKTVKEAEEKYELIESNLKSRTNKLESFLQEKEITVKKLAEVLKEQENAFNFVGLSKGFETLLKTKKTAKSWAFFLLLSIGMFLCIAPIAYIQTIMNSTIEIINDPYVWKLAIPFTGLEIILLYFFRVVLSHYNSIQTQIMQLELRQSLCQFIQSYADYAKEIKEKDGSSLEKFENLIFSSILSNSDKVPSTFDGLEQLANFIKEFKK
ncbi:hypothetical protein BMT54_10370 [Pasteurellaceae bacterium 15-036681]|nr:hypothetical protein BMT54_10370 [Pasteurellaceae bacterium 15-036681]